MNHSKTHKKQEGIAMLVAMVMIMMVTATAMYSVTATTTELRSTGYARQALQTRNIAKAALVTSLEWMDIVGPGNVADLVEQNRLAGNPIASESEGFPEPGFTSDVPIFRMYPEHVKELLPTESSTEVYMLNVPYQSATSVGTSGAFAPRAVVDFYETVIETRPMPGQSSDGHRKLRYIRTTITARGRTMLGSDYELSDDAVGFNQGAWDVRAYVRSGPFID